MQWYSLAQSDRQAAFSKTWRWPSHSLSSTAVVQAAVVSGPVGRGSEPLRQAWTRCQSVTTRVEKGHISWSDSRGSFTTSAVHAHTQAHTQVRTRTQTNATSLVSTHPGWQVATLWPCVGQLEVTGICFKKATVNTSGCSNKHICHLFPAFSFQIKFLVIRFFEMCCSWITP